MNIKGLVDALAEQAAGQGLKGMKIGYVLGDEIPLKFPGFLRKA